MEVSQPELIEAGVNTVSAEGACQPRLEWNGLAKAAAQVNSEKMLHKALLWMMLIAFAMAAQAQWAKAPLQPPTAINPNLYRADADAPKEIHEAITTAAKQHKRVLLVFGANWCIDCHVLERAFHQPRIEPLLNDNFVVVHVDVGQYERNLELAKKYRVDLEKGVPSVAVLNGAGALVHSGSEFEKARLMTEQDVVDFLNQWKPKKIG